MFHSQTELFEDIILSEDSTMEFRREMPHRDSMADEIAAFANSDGGTIPEAFNCRVFTVSYR